MFSRGPLCWLLVVFLVVASQWLLACDTADSGAISAEPAQEDMSSEFIDAIVANDQATVERLLTAGIDPNGADDFSGTPYLHYALGAAHQKKRGEATQADYETSQRIVRLLVEHGARITDPARYLTGDDHSALWFHIVASGEPELVQIMLDAGLDVNVRDRLILHANRWNAPETAMISAAKGACWPDDPSEQARGMAVLRLLVAAGADVNTMTVTRLWDNSGRRVIGITESRSVLSLVQGSRHPCTEAIQLLQAAGARDDMERRRIEWGPQGQPPAGLDEIVAALARVGQ